MKERASAFLVERVARKMAERRIRELSNSLPERRSFIERGFDYQEAEFATARTKHTDKARQGHGKAIEALDEVKRQQKQLSARRSTALATLEREVELIAPGAVTFVAHALVVPSIDPEDKQAHDANVEQIAMQVASAFEEAAGARVIDVHTPPLARRAGLQDSPGFGLQSHRPEESVRAIEVKGRAGTGDVEVSANEWAKACNMRADYWLYVVYDCATATPRLVRVQDPFGALLAGVKGSMLISAKEVYEASNVSG